jgi:DnaJ-class molecular chaperone
MEYYSTLGLTPGASPDEIKKAYKKAAMKHHPDRGGNEAMFKQVSEAYDVLSDPQKKQMVDMGVDPLKQQGGGPQHGGFGFGGHPGFEDVFNHFGFNPFGGFQQQRQRRNSSIQVTVEVTLADVLHGKSMEAEIGMPAGQRKLITINIPAGVHHGQQIKYGGMGDTGIPNAPPGDLIVNIRVRPHEVFQREHNNLTCEWKMSVWDAMLGTAVELRTLDNRVISITIPPGTQPDTVFSCSNEGLPDVHNKIKGKLMVKIKLGIPKNLTEEQKELVTRIKNGN